jgi:outer membrane receptor protein involved in Fe transport
MFSHGAQLYNHSRATSTTLSLFGTDLWDISERVHLDVALRAEQVMHRGAAEESALITQAQIGSSGDFARDGDGNVVIGTGIQNPGGADRNFYTFYDNGSKIGSGKWQTYNFIYRYLSGSLGINYKLNEGLALYTRLSRGNKAPELAFYFSNFVNQPIRQGRVEGINMGEVGVKMRTRQYALFLTGFYSSMDNVGFQLLVPGRGGEVVFTPSTFNSIRTLGLECEGYANPVRNLTIRTTLKDPRFRSFTYYNMGSVVDYRFVDPVTGVPNTDPATGLPNGSDDYLEDFSGNQLSDVPRVMLEVTPTYRVQRLELFVNWRYTGIRYANRRNTLELPAFSLFHAGMNLRLTRHWLAALRLNNMFNQVGLLSFDGIGKVGRTPEDLTPALLAQNALMEQPNPYFVRPTLPRMVVAKISYQF